jgi:hypothetical protein
LLKNKNGVSPLSILTILFIRFVVSGSATELDSEVFFDFFGGDHVDGVPWTAIQEGAIGTLAGAFFTANAELRVHFDAAERRVVFVGNPVHAVFDRAIFDTRGRPGAAGTILSDDCKFFGNLLSWCD